MGLIIILIIIPIVVDGEWSQWVISGSCKTNGKRERTRTCTDPAPLNGGKQCPGSNKDEVSCPGCSKNLFLEKVSQLTFTSVDGQWSQWVWVSSESCKTNGKIERTRTCTNPAPLNGGKQCPGSNKDEVSCPGKENQI